MVSTLRSVDDSLFLVRDLQKQGNPHDVGIGSFQLVSL